ncbi:MAG: hypothetical protein RR922_05190 [Clostridia bacterium]
MNKILNDKYRQYIVFSMASILAFCLVSKSATYVLPSVASANLVKLSVIFTCIYTFFRSLEKVNTALNVCSMVATKICALLLIGCMYITSVDLARRYSFRNVERLII